ncbi:diguanylate cyclase [Onishia niordana]|uniref:diguanylate cyclase n=1 Tax=Onishia niordana TaxID=2508711 RepID=UPI00109FF044|nr:diguanylate cyclase [Halomonas niordiana]
MTPLPNLYRCLLRLFISLTLVVTLTLIFSEETTAAGSAPHLASVAIFHDQSGELEAADLMIREEDFREIKARSDLQIGYVRHPVWLRLQITSADQETQEAILRFLYPLLERVSLYEIRDGVIHQERQSGLAVAPDQRAYTHRLPAFLLHIPPSETLTLLARVDSAGSISLGTEMLSIEGFQRTNDLEMFWLSAYVGILLALGLYNLMLYVGLKERVFLLYAVFATSFCVAVITSNGLGPLILWQGLGDSTARIITLGFTLSAFFGTLFAQQFLCTHRHVPGWHRVLNGLLIACLVGVIAAAMLPLELAMPLMDVTGIATCLMLLACAISCSCLRVPGARLFVLAWAFLLVGALIFALRNLGIIPSNVLTVYGIQAGSALEMILLSIALGARFNAIKRQKEKAQAQVVAALKEQEAILEERVAQRTSELVAIARRDTLTGLLNRTGLAEVASGALQRSRMRGLPLAVLMLDLDDFKPINDQFGHSAGDFVLKIVAERLRHQVRHNTHCARFGGDEFVVICEDIGGTAEAYALKKRLEAAIREPIRLPSGDFVQAGVSIGISFGDSQTQDLDTLLNKADLDMYASKKSCRIGSAPL